MVKELSVSNCCAERSMCDHLVEPVTYTYQDNCNTSSKWCFSSDPDTLSNSNHTTVVQYKKTRIHGKHPNACPCISK